MLQLQVDPSSIAGILEVFMVRDTSLQLHCTECRDLHRYHLQTQEPS